MTRKEIKNTLEYEKKFYDLGGVEIAEEDIDYVEENIEDGMSEEDAIADVLLNISATLN